MMRSKKYRQLIIGSLFLGLIFSFLAVIQVGIFLNHTKEFVIIDLLSTNVNFLYFLFLWGAVVLTITKITPLTAVRYANRRQVLWLNFKSTVLINLAYAVIITTITAISLASQDFSGLMPQLFLPYLMVGWLNGVVILIIYYLVRENLLLTNAFYLGFILINCWLPFFNQDPIKPYNLLLTVSWSSANWPLDLLASILVLASFTMIAKEALQQMEVY